jgi:hypothetical protein
MKRLDRIGGTLVGVCLALLCASFATVWGLRSPVIQAKAAPLFAPKPVYNWYVCRNLGFGYVPGVPDPRQRLKLCHETGWEVYTYCAQPGLPVPPVGRGCRRISEDTYVCGASYQRVREYRILQTPVDTPTPTTTQIVSTVTPTLTATATLTATPTQTQAAGIATPTTGSRVRPGGEGNATQLRGLILVEIGVLLLAAILGVWIVRRITRRG